MSPAASPGHTRTVHVGHGGLSRTGQRQPVNDHPHQSRAHVRADRRPDLGDPVLPQPRLHLDLRETDGQLVIGWDRQSQTGGRLEIVDRTGRTVLAVPPGSTSTTYAHHSSDVEVRLSSGTRTGHALWTAPRIFNRPFDPRAAAR